MANNVFKGFKQVASSYEGTFEDGFLYFVRTNSGKTDGYIYFNGKKYGTAKDVENELKAIIGDIPTGETVASYIQDVDSALTVEIAARKAMDNSIMGNSTGSTTSAATIYDLRRAVDALGTSNHAHENKSVLDGISAEKVAAWDSAEQNAKNYADSAITESIQNLDATVSGSDNGVTVEITEADGIITVVSVTAPNFATTYDELGAADKAYSAATAYTASAIEALDADVSGESNGVSVRVVEANGVITTVAVDAPDFAETYDAKGAAESALTAATAYTDTQITAAINGLDATVSGQSTQGVKVEIAQVDGKLTGVTVTGPDLSNVYDAKGAAESALTSAHTYTDEAIAGLDMASAVTLGAGETVASIDETDGIVTVTKQNIAITHDQVSDWDTELGKKQDNLVFKTAYDADTNKVITEADINDLAGAMHFVGVSTTDPATEVTISGYTTPENGDVCIYGVKEYVYANNAWHELGDESLFVTKATTIAGVDLQDNISKTEMLTALNVEDGAQVNKLEKIEVNGTEVSMSGTTAQITLPSATESGSSNGVKVTVEQVSGEVASVTVEAPNFDNEYDELGAAASAKTEAIDTASAYTDTQIAAAINRLDATVSGESAQGVAVTVAQVDGVITAVTVTGPDFDTTYDELGAADKAYSAATANTASAIEALDADVSGESNGVSVRVVEANGVITTVTVDATALDSRIDNLEAVSAGTRLGTLEAVSADTRLQALEALTGTTNSALQGIESGDTSVIVTAKDASNVQTVAVAISSAIDNALERKNDGLFAAIYYEDLDTE